MSNSKNTDRRVNSPSAQESSDLNSAITELHQTIVRLNHAIDKVHPKTKAEAQRLFSASNTEKDVEITLANLKISHTVH